MYGFLGKINLIIYFHDWFIFVQKATDELSFEFFLFCVRN